MRIGNNIETISKRIQSEKENISKRNVRETISKRKIKRNTDSEREAISEIWIFVRFMETERLCCRYFFFALQMKCILMSARLSLLYLGPHPHQMHLEF